MYYISITKISRNQARSMKFLTGMTLFWDSRFKRYEFRGSKQKHKKFLVLFIELSKIVKGDIHDWDSKKEYSEVIYEEIK
jgi:hypothetical protein